MTVEHELSGAETDRSPQLRGRPQASIGRIIFGCLSLSLWHGTKWLVIAGVTVVAGYALVLVLLRFVDPPSSMLMVQRKLAGTEIAQYWVPLDRISSNLINAVVVSEDARFCVHSGIDFRELEQAMEKAAERGDLTARGASTISMQVIKNMFLWSDRSFVRKGLEFVMTPTMELVWPKRRILEIYLNIAEWGPGVFGAEAAARYHFDKTARQLTAREAALLAVSLPNPFERVAGEPGRALRQRARTIETRMASAARYTRCVQKLSAQAR